jgi:hypothetical protein
VSGGKAGDFESVIFHKNSGKDANFTPVIR